MDESTNNNEHSLRQHQSTSSTLSAGSGSTFVASPVTPISPTVYRPGYQRVSSIAEHAPQEEGAPAIEGSEYHGLGLSFLSKSKRDSTARVPVGSKSTESSPALQSTDPLLSPTVPNVTKDSYHNDQANQSSLTVDGNGIQGSDVHLPHGHKTHEEYEALHQKSPAAYHRDFPCSTKKSFSVGRGNWLAISILLLSIYSTVMSGLWFVVACRRPRYGMSIFSTTHLPILGFERLTLTSLQSLR